MSLETRLKLYAEIERLRGRPLIVYVTSPREGADGMMSSDVLPEFCDQLELLPPDTTALDLLLVSDGGDPMVALRIVTLVRERVKDFAVLVPNAAYSAATLLALGANEIVMHPNGNLGPVDPQIVVRGPDGRQTAFGFEDMSGFLKYVRTEVGLTDQEHVRAMLEMFCQQFSPGFVGKAARSALLSQSVGEKLLLTHMTGDPQKPRRIVESLNKSFYHHGYPINRKEAKENDLPVADWDSAETQRVERLIWQVWADIERELEFRSPFDPGLLFMTSPQGQQLLTPVPMLNLPADTPADVANQVFQGLLQSAVQFLAPVEFVNTSVAVESSRRASHYRDRGRIFATRLPNLTIESSVVMTGRGWEQLPLPPVPVGSEEPTP